jgi:hypothetical protein
MFLTERLRLYKGASRLIVLMLRLVSLRKCGQFHEPEPKQRDQPEPCAPAVRYSGGRTVCTHRATVTPSLCSTSPNSAISRSHGLQRFATVSVELSVYTGQQLPLVSVARAQTAR